MKIRLASNKDLGELKNIYREVIKDLKNVKKIDFLWREEYPIDYLDIDLKGNGLYVVENNSKLIGGFAINDYDEPEYRDLNWRLKNNKFLYFGRLAILPSEQGKGYATEAIKFVDKYAENHNYQSIRLVVYDKNINAINLYKKFNYKQLEGEGLDYKNKLFIGFEKILID